MFEKLVGLSSSMMLVGSLLSHQKKIKQRFLDDFSYNIFCVALFLLPLGKKKRGVFFVKLQTESLKFDFGYKRMCGSV